MQGSIASHRKTDLCGAAQPGVEFVQLNIWKLQMTEKVLVKALSVLTRPGEPGGDGGLPVAEDAFGRGSIQSFGQCRQHDGDLLGRGFQPVQGRVAAGTERRVARLTAEGLNLLGTAMLAIPDERMNVRVSDAEVRALLVGTGEAIGGYALRSSPAAFHLAPGAYRSRYWSSTQRGSGGASTGGAIVGGSWLEQTMERRTHRGLCFRLDKTMMGPAQGTEPRQREDE